MNKDDGQPWWKYAHVWMVFALPAIVVVASFITLYLAIETPDPVVSDYGQAARTESAEPQALLPPNMAPAVQGRNHAATGISLPATP